MVQGNLDLKSDPWPSISAEAKDCVKNMLTVDPSKVHEKHMLTEI